MYLQEKTFSDLDLGFKVIRSVVQFTLHHVTYTPAKFEVNTSNGLVGEDAFTKNTLFDLDLWFMVTGNVTQYPLHHVTYTPLTLEVNTSNDAFTRKCIFLP